MNHKYSIGDILFCNTDIVEPFYIMILDIIISGQDNVLARQHNVIPTAWQVDVYRYINLDDGDEGYEIVTYLDNDHSFIKVV